MFSILSNFLLKLSLSIFSFSRYPLIPFKEQIHFNSDFSYLVPFIRLNFAKERIVWLCYFWETRGPSATCSSFFHNCYLRSLCFFSFKATNDCQKMILANLISQLLISLSFIAYLYSFSSVFLTFPFPCVSIHHCLFHLTEPSSSFELRTLSPLSLQVFQFLRFPVFPATSINSPKNENCTNPNPTNSRLQFSYIFPMYSGLSALLLISLLIEMHQLMSRG